MATKGSRSLAVHLHLGPAQRKGRHNPLLLFEISLFVLFMLVPCTTDQLRMPHPQRRNATATSPCLYHHRDARPARRSWTAVPLLGVDDAQNYKVLSIRIDHFAECLHEIGAPFSARHDTAAFARMTVRRRLQRRS